MDALLAVWADSPAVTRILLVTYPLTWLLLQTELFSEFISTLFYFTPSTFLGDFWFWTIATSSFVQFPSDSLMEDLLILVLVTVVLAQMLPQQEKAMGSTLMIWWLVAVGIAIRLTFLALTFVLGKVMVLLGAVETNWFGPYADLPCSGLWPMSLAFIAIQSFAAMDGNTSVFGYVDIPNKFYPVLVYMIVTLLSGSLIRPELLAGLIMGYFYGTGQIPNDWMLPKKRYVSSLEDSVWRVMCQKLCLGPDGQGAVCLGARYIFISEVRPSRAFGGDSYRMDTLGYDRIGAAREMPA
jgi:hypothetical protein